MMKIILKISGMHCTSCAFNIDGELEDTEGVREAKTNYAKQITEVEFDDASVKIENLQQTIAQLGYSSEILSSK